MSTSILLLCAAALATLAAQATPKPRARDLGVPFEGAPGPHNAITDVAGVEVGFTTLNDGSKIRTGVSAILPRGKTSVDPVMAGWFSLNGKNSMIILLGSLFLHESSHKRGCSRQF